MPEDQDDVDCAYCAEGGKLEANLARKPVKDGRVGIKYGASVATYRFLMAKPANRRQK